MLRKMMGRCKILIFVWLLALPVAGSAQEAASLLAKRLLGNEVRHFVFCGIPATEAVGDTFFVAPSVDGKHILIGGNNDISMAVGLNHYLRKYAKVHVSWFNTEPLQLPKKWPLPPRKEGGRASVPQRFFLNYCTYGYTMVWWQWPQWERFIDWMALNGITMPLALTGQEAVWQEVWREMGMTDDEIRAYFSGPAHLPWHRMANLDGFGGPLPQSWIDGQRELQKQILERERALGMTPVLPAFAGHVPQRIAETQPQADIQRLSPWCGFEPTCFLNSTDPLFADVQRRYLAKQEALYGTDHIYGVDPFNEMDPPSWEPDYLAAVSEGIYRTLQQSDPEARWLQMSWVFYYKRKQWTPERLKAYLTAVPQDSLVLLDYFCEKTEVWRQTEGFYGQPFIWCYLGNFGGNTMLVGDLYAIEKKLKSALQEADRNLMGVGSTLEGFDCSPQTYEFLFASVWGVSADDFVDQWADMRYGKENGNVRQAWHLLADSVYKDWSFYGLGTQMVARPDFEGHGTYYTKPYYSYNNDRLLEAIRLLMEKPSERYGYEYDLVNLLSQWMGNRFMDLRNAFTEAYKAGDTAAMQRAYRAAERLTLDADRLLYSLAEFNFHHWIHDARRWGSDDLQLRDYYETQARVLLTVWGGPVLNDYANRLWGGLLEEYYWQQRWKPFFTGALEARRNGTDFDEETFKKQLSEREQEFAYKTRMYQSKRTKRKNIPLLEQAQTILTRISQGFYNP
ncbi:MAG: alpha-N-acetylglucosaminidase [Bacteroidales bacterium]|nr:alpha-N-acetylglucosaminidase [Bacteroidales bacterium]